MKNTIVRNERKKEEEQYKLIVENSSDLIAAIDLEGNFIYVSPSHAHVLGYKPEELVGVNSFSLMHPDDRERVFGEFLRGIEGHQTMIDSFRARHKDGSFRYLETSGAIVLNKDNKPYQFVAVLRDVTTRVENEKKKNAFINILSHELRTPLTSIMILTSLLEKKIPHAEEEFSSYFFKLKEQSTNLAQLIQSLIDVWEIDQGQLNLDKEEFFIDEFIKHQLSFYKEKIEQKIIIRNGESERVYADKRRLREVFNVLLSNAVKYSSAQTPITINIYKNEEHAEVAITDYGPGIPLSEQRKIFEKFYQFGDQTRYLRPGFGVGLYFARELIKMHKGKLWVRSEYGEGSTFYFSLPLFQSYL